MHIKQLYEKINAKLDKDLILIVDDTPEHLAQISEILCDKYSVKVSSSGEKAVIIAETYPPPNLILLDIMMPSMNGYQVCELLKNNPKTADIPVIFMTSSSDLEDERLGYSVGAVDYMVKPVIPSLLLAHVEAHLSLKRTNDILKNQKFQLEQEINMRMKEIKDTSAIAIHAIAALIETRGNHTGNHIIRVQNYVKSLALRLQNHKKFKNYLTDEVIDLLYKSSPLYDIGTIGVLMTILKNVHNLNEEDRATYKTHPVLGYQAIVMAEKRLGYSVRFLEIAKEFVLSHHENWDGTGYPHGLAGEEIPISARLVAVAIGYDEIISSTQQGCIYTHADAMEIIRQESGKKYDPDVVEAFLQSEVEFSMMVEWFADQKLA